MLSTQVTKVRSLPPLAAPGTHLLLVFLELVLSPEDLEAGKVADVPSLHAAAVKGLLVAMQASGSHPRTTIVAVHLIMSKLRHDILDEDEN